MKKLLIIAALMGCVAAWAGAVVIDAELEYLGTITEQDFSNKGTKLVADEESFKLSRIPPEVKESMEEYLSEYKLKASDGFLFFCYDLELSTDIAVLLRITTVNKNGTYSYSFYAVQHGSPPQATAASNGPGIYISGWANYTPLYWKDGVYHELPKTNRSYAHAITVSGGNLYMAGLSNDKPVYWKNGTQTVLPSGNNTNGIAVAGNDVYVAGTNYGDKQLLPVYWKNGTCYQLPFVYGGIVTSESGYKAGSGTKAVAIAGNDVYIVGNDGYRAVYWKNGTRVELPQSAGTDGRASVSSIAVAGKDVYMAGRDSDDRNGYAVYWKNGERIVLPSTGAGGASASAITVTGSDVYVAGVEYEDVPEGRAPQKPVYWKNDKRFELPITGREGFVNAIAADGEDVYVVGRDGYYTIVYWKNGKRIELLKLGDNKYGDATGIVIVP